jgi:hypothetical protein
MERRDFLRGSTTAAALAMGAKLSAAATGGERVPGALPGQPEAPKNGDGKLKLLFSDRRDIHNTWGSLRFGATRVQRAGDAPQKQLTVKYCQKRQDGSYDVWGFQGADHRPWKLFRCRTQDGINFEDVHVVLERSGREDWAHTCSVSYSPELRRYLFLKNMNVADGFSLYAYSSADGEHWQEYEHNPVFIEGDRWGALWSSALQKFVYYGKGIQKCEKRFPELFANARRVMTIRTSPDGFHWTPDDPSYYKRNAKSPPGHGDGFRHIEGPLVPVEFQVIPDELDPPDMEFYAGDGFAYEGRYYFLMLNYAASALPAGNGTVGVNGHGPALDTEWWVSRDGFNWDRPFRHIDAGQMFLSHNPMIVGGRMLFHDGDGLYSVPEDRITYVTSRANGVFDTPQFRSPGRPFRLNAKVPGETYSNMQNQAYIMAEIVDEIDQVFPGYEREHCFLQPPVDKLDIPLRWGDRDATELRGKNMRVRFYLRASNIYAVTA